MTRNRVFLWIQAALCAAVCILLAAGVIGIFREGMALRAAGDVSTWIFTREKAAEQLWRISPLIFGSIAVTAAGLILGIKDEKADHPVRDIEITRDLLCMKVSAPSEKMAAERRTQKKLQRTGIVLAVLCAIPVLIYMLNGSHFETLDLEEMICQTTLHILPWIILGLGSMIITDSLRLKSISREVEYAKEQIRAEAEDSAVNNIDAAGTNRAKANGTRIRITAKPGDTCNEASDPSTGTAEKHAADRKLHMIRCVLLSAAAVCIIYGIFNGSMRDVFVKASNVCTECIGLG